jgi:hypothetical protein
MKVGADTMATISLSIVDLKKDDEKWRLTLLLVRYF